MGVKKLVKMAVMMMVKVEKKVLRMWNLSMVLEGMGRVEGKIEGVRREVKGAKKARSADNLKAKRPMRKF